MVQLWEGEEGRRGYTGGHGRGEGGQGVAEALVEGGGRGRSVLAEGV